MGVARIFDWEGEGAKHKSHVMTSSKFFKSGKNFLWNKYIVDWKIRSCGQCVCTQPKFCFRERRKPKTKMRKLGDALSKLVYVKLITDGGLGEEPPAARGQGSVWAKPPAAGQFFVKTSYFNAITIQFARV